MKKLLLLLGLVVCVGSAQTAHAQNLQNFTINSFDADYYLTRDDKNVSQLKVIETIVAQFPDFDQNHGILRAVPQKYKGNSLNLQIQSVKKPDGSNWNYSTYTQNDNLVLRVGDADRYVHGRQSYQITYTMRNVVTFYHDHDEWYWDVNGSQWQQPINSVTARVHVPTTLARSINKDSVCYTGYYQQSGIDCAITTSPANTEDLVTVTTTKLFSAGENLSFVMSFQPGMFHPYRMDPRLVLLVVVAVLGSFALPVLVLTISMYRKWRTSGRDPKGRGVIVPQYKPESGMNPLLADVVLNERMQTKAVTAAILDLCVNGYIKLYQTTQKKLLKDTTDYELELIKPVDQLSGEMQEVARLFFTDIGQAGVGTRVTVNNQSHKLYTKVATLTKTVNATVATQGYFVSDPDKARARYIWITGVLFGVSFIGFSVFRPWLIGLSLGCITSGFIAMIFNAVMPARTQKGVASKEFLLGLKDYMNLAEKDRIKFLQGPDTAEKIDVSDKTKLVKLYEKLLPYALLFGIEKQWSKQFADLYGSDDAPDWYVGNSAFNAVVIGNAISSFNATAVSSFTPPASSSSSGFSSGGGFSGGGGGGGGGGGW